MEPAECHSNNVWLTTLEYQDMNQEARIDELESRLAQQDHALLEISDEVYQQQQQIAQLEIQVRHLVERLKSIAPAESASNPADERPPHY